MTLVFADCRGSPREMGRAYGAAAGNQIATAMAFFNSLAAHRGVDIDEAERAVGPYIDAARAAAPDLMDELEGIGEGSGSGFDSVALLNCLEEVWPFEACTTVMTGRFLVHAEQWLAGHGGVTLIAARPERGPCFVAPSSPGCLAATGMNSAGLAQGIDSLQHEDERVGIPRTFVARSVLGTESLDAAIAAATTPGRAGGYAHVLATGSERAVVETSAATDAVLSDVCAHTNHYLGDPPRDGVKEGSKARLRRALQLLASGAESLEACMSLLSDHNPPGSICRHEEGLEGEVTVFGMICDLHEGVVVFSDGSPCAGRWHEVAVPGFRKTADVV